MLQDQITYVLVHGRIDLEIIKRLDLRSFRSLHDSIVKLKQADDQTRFLDTRAAFHAAAKQFKDFIAARFPNDPSNAPTEATVNSNGMRSFLQKVNRLK